MNRLIQAKNWLSIGLKEFYAARKTYCNFYLISVGLLAAETIKIDQLSVTSLPTLDKWVGTMMDSSFIGPIITWLFNTLTSGPDEIYEYSNMPATTELLLFVIVLVACLTFPFVSFGYIATDAYGIWHKRRQRKALKHAPSDE